MLTQHQPNEDPFQKARTKNGVMQCPFQGEEITMLLKHEDVRRAAADWKQFSSDAAFRVPIPSEQAVRTMRQLPIEVDPPVHAEYRAITDPFFQRAKKPAVINAVKNLIQAEVSSLANLTSFDAVSELALPIQSRALTYLLNMPEPEADIWIKWGIHVFQPAADEIKTGDALEYYLQRQFDRAEANPGGDFFSALVTAQFQGRKLSREECMGFGNLTFAGGRDTIIHTITSIIAWLADHPEALQTLREDPRRIVLASEEFFRVFMPLTQIGRVCPEETEIHGVKVNADHRIGLCWASANFDESVFENSHEVRLDRRPNPHMSFGFRNHLCQGAAHARLVIRSLLETLCEQNILINVKKAERHIEHEKKFTRAIGYETLQVQFSKVKSRPENKNVMIDP
ncbi:MAG: cytochrome P450 [Fuerstiella sp.]